jgi:hypothetical protein
VSFTRSAQSAVSDHGHGCNFGYESVTFKLAADEPQRGSHYCDYHQTSDSLSSVSMLSPAAGFEAPEWQLELNSHIETKMGAKNELITGNHACTGRGIGQCPCC